MRLVKRLIAMGLAVGLASVAACKSDVRVFGTPPGGGAQTSTVLNNPTDTAIDKVDLLFVIDNSRSMADKQEVLQSAVPDLLKRLVNPSCVDGKGVASAEQPAGPSLPCPTTGTRREFPPLTDMHIGVLTSSIGGHGATGVCEPEPSVPGSEMANDKAHLIDRADPDDLSKKVPTWDGKGFLVWDPSDAAPTHTPQGETVADTLIDKLESIVSGSGERGCGYEAQLEAWYRFLIEPAPYESLEVQGAKAVAVGTDQLLLQQRADFLRPDSLLLIVMLTDENDCSIMDVGINPTTDEPNHGLGHFAADFYTKLPAARPECAVDPNDPCCASCGQQPQPSGCPDVSAVCSQPLLPFQDTSNQRCFDQKRRFGIDFLWPIERYLTGLTNTQVPDRDGNVMLNPIFADLDPTDAPANTRDPSKVLFVGIVGVPWQDIARKNGSGEADLIHGLDSDGRKVGGFQSSSELVKDGTWDLILGDPECYVTDPNCRPTDPHMIETDEKRAGTGAFNGGEHTIAEHDDLQYACRFELPTAKDCSGAAICDCPKDGSATDNPLCDPNDSTKQTHAKAYPGIRHLQVIRGIGEQGVVASICPAQQEELAGADYGYRPAMLAIIERIKSASAGQCLPEAIQGVVNGQAPCFILEGRRVSEGQVCTCDSAGRQHVTVEHASAVKPISDDPFYEHLNCFCEIKQTIGKDLAACSEEPSEPVVNSDGAAVDGWCYIDATTVPPLGDPELVEDCPDTMRRRIRFVGGGVPAAGATTVLVCGS